jgi:uncharacterized protein (TIGR03118 family)
MSRRLSVSSVSADVLISQRDTIRELNNGSEYKSAIRTYSGSFGRPPSATNDFLLADESRLGWVGARGDHFRQSHQSLGYWAQRNLAVLDFHNGTGVTTVYDGAGNLVPIAGHDAITIAAAPGQESSSPTGQVFNTAGSGFDVTLNGVTASSVFLFATTNGTISGWSPTVDSGSSVIAVDNSQGSNPVAYTGLAIGTTHQATFLYAANFSNGTVDMFDSQFDKVSSFTDPNLPSGYAPFNVQVLDGKLYVTFAQQDPATHRDAPGPGHGFVDAFDLNGNMLNRVATQGVLNSPWGLDIAPQGFGKFSGDLLVGNFGDGTIDAFDPHTDKFMGQLLGGNGIPLQIQDLWALTNGTGANATDPNAVYTLFKPESENPWAR